ncbi:Nudix family hydrolase [Nevskia sp.]|uniref:Nudix family hydrolase n=1 Tax=Nevskia sp. TaxID=1929292 RepID=UPI0025DAD163|nr:Nudix family hydrolase [Nevskia sp.]
MNHALPLIPVACGVLLDGEGRLLIAQRPAGKIAAGKWEFPGGKIEPGETVLQALTRELHEELGITVTRARPLLRFRHDYRDRHVLLDTWCVDAWDGEPASREQQAFAWLTPDGLADLDLLPTVAPIVTALRLPPQYVFTRPDATLIELLTGLTRLPRGALMRLRLPSLTEREYAALASTLLPAAHAAGLKLIVDRDPAMVAMIGADGWHATSAALARYGARPIAADRWFGASVHSNEQLQAAQIVGADFAVLGPVFETATHPGADGIGWAGFAARRGVVGLPVYALGGLDLGDLFEARQHGAQGIAAISAYWPR